MKSTFWLVLLAAVVLLAAAAMAGRAFLRIEWIQLQIRRKFPEVPQMSGAELSRRLAAGEPVALLDVRREDEYAVSHLAGARRLAPGEKDLELPGIARDATVVTYCSVGWRSSQMGMRLKEAGFEDVHNLDGSIFKWTREGRPLVQSTLAGERPVTKVHPYSQAWAFLVPPEKRAFHPEEAGADPEATAAYSAS